MAYIHKVKYYECDRMGITHHSNYARFMEEARVDLLDRLGYGFEKMEAEGVVSPVLAIEVHFLKSTTFQDEIEVEVGLRDVSTFKFEFEYIMRVNGETVCKATSRHCLIKESRPLPYRKYYPELFARIPAPEAV